MIDEERRDFYLYYIYRRYDENGIEEVCYVGRGCGDRIDDHIKNLKNGKHGNWLLQEWFDASDSTLFPCVIFTDLTNDEANALEIKHIAEYGRFDLGLGTLANLTDGGDGVAGYVLTPEQRAKLSAAKKGNKSRLGKKHVPETLALMSLSAKKRGISAELRAKMSSGRIGKKQNVSPEAKKRRADAIAESNRNRVYTEYIRRNISEAHKGIKPSAEALLKRSESMKQVWQRRWEAKAAQEQHTLKQAAD